jgi:hypothetical protein
MPCEEQKQLSAMYRYAMLENIATMAFTVLLVLLLAMVFQNLHCLWGLLMLLNINTYKSKSK